ncbi:hypothetical protein O0I10_011488 [Lichtheimia ornata]|uniref:Uncharacterized protein n=1 Tax=Lichtheimia ornata TaxID=688661 RepID=A0AAD7UTK8_9FUNG|nr:uncharacterized protein O0I10_011488 [Lichtheimia ornata]KAJ8652888.1 hypothetical protein O0I10_011488 [Lichtheimia ornata]
MKFSFIISLVFAIALTDLTVAWTSAVEIRKNMERCQKISLDECPAARKCAIEESDDGGTSCAYAPNKEDE